MNFVENFNLFGTEVAQIPCIKQSGAPSTSTVGAVGCFYMDSDTMAVYKCTVARLGYYQWEPLSAAEISTIVCEASGTEIVLADSADMPIRKFTIDGGGLMAGETVGISVSGRNLFDISKVVRTEKTSVDGGTITMDATGFQYDIFTGDSGTSHKVAAEKIDKLPMLHAGTYTISYRKIAPTDSGFMRVYTVADDGSVTAATSGNGTGVAPQWVFTFTLEKASRITIRRSVNGTMIVENLQIEAGSTAHPYEPFRGVQEDSVTIADNGEGGGAVTDVLEQHPGIMAFKPTTIIRTTSNGGMNMVVAYTADPKTYIENKFAEIQAAVLSLGANI